MSRLDRIKFRYEIILQATLQVENKFTLGVRLGSGDSAFSDILNAVGVGFKTVRSKGKICLRLTLFKNLNTQAIV